MASKSLFRSILGPLLPATDALNEEAAPAYAFSPEGALAQYASTGCLSSTFYASDAEQLAKVLELCAKVDPEFIARTAIHARSAGHMKDVPALLCAVLSVRAPALLVRVFPRVIDDGRMLRSFVQILRSGAVGRKSLGTLPRRLVREWLAGRSDEALFRASVGSEPSLADVVRMVHPRPATASRAALYGYLLGRPHAEADLPALVREFEAHKAGAADGLPDVPFQMLTGLPLGAREWTEIALKAPWQMTRMNLNTFARHGVFDDPGVARLVADRLRDPEAVRRSKVFPYQLMVAQASAAASVPRVVSEALHDAMEIAVGNVPSIDGKAYVFPDVSGSMRSPITGHRKGATSAVQCVHVAALVAAAVLRRNPDAEVIPFASEAVEVRLEPRDTVLTNAGRLASLPAGGTNSSAPLALLNRRGARGDLLIYISDNESWIDAPCYGRYGGSRTATLEGWALFKARNPRARMVCIDIQPYGTTQAAEREDILNIGGFSDRVFDVIGEFAAGRLGPDHSVGEIRKVEL